MYNHYSPKKEPDRMVRKKRPFLLWICGIFSVAVIFGSGFIVGFKVQEKRQGLLSTIEESKKQEIDKNQIRSERGSGQTPEGYSKNPSEVPPGKDLTFYQTLMDNKKQTTVGLEPIQDSTQRQVSGRPIQKKGQESSKITKNPDKTYTVQVGAYKEMAVAKKVMNKLKKKGYRAYIFEKAIPQHGIIYKVRVGEFPDREKAEELARSLKEKEKMDSFVTLK